MCLSGSMTTPSYLTLCIQETLEQVLWQTVKTQMKCRITWRFIMVRTVCYDEAEFYLNLAILTCDSLIFAMNYSRPIVWNQMEEFIIIHKAEGAV